MIHTISSPKPAALARGLSNCLLFAGADDTLPMLTCVLFDCDDTALRLVTTDRYRLCIEPINDAQFFARPFTLLLRRPAVKALIAALKSASARETIVLDYDDEKRTLTFTAGGSGTAATWPTEDMSFPPWRSLIPADGERVPVDRIGFNPKMLADLGKVQTATRLAHVEIKLNGPKMTSIQYDGGPLVLFVPVRLPE